MKRILPICLAIAALTIGATAQVNKAAAPVKRLESKNLPPEVQRTIQNESKGAEIKNISKETEHGVAQYEVETILNGKHRDFDVNTKGVLLAVEEETTLDAIPTAAKATILRKIADGKLGMVEISKRGGEALYEAAYTSKGGKKREVLVKADGTETKD